MIRSILSVIAGFATWAGGWCVANFAAQAAWPSVFGSDGSLRHSGLLGGFVALSLALSLLAGFVTARVAREQALRCASVLAAVQLAIGVAVQAQYWSKMPLWYHLAFLTLLVPGILAGARAAANKPRVGAADLAIARAC